MYSDMGGVHNRYNIYVPVATLRILNPQPLSLIRYPISPLSDSANRKVRSHAVDHGRRWHHAIATSRSNEQWVSRTQS
jgi:hypothetical protein